MFLTMAYALCFLLAAGLFLYGVYVVLGLFDAPERVRYAVVVVLGIVCLLFVLAYFAPAPPPWR